MNDPTTASAMDAAAAATLAPLDVVIVGGGLVGASLALALSQLNLRIALIEATMPSVGAHPSFDDRTTALSNGSKRIFQALEVWPLIEREATPIRRIHVSDQGRFGFARISAEEQGLDALGYVVTNRVMGAALWRRLGEAGITVLAPVRVSAMQLDGGVQRLECATDVGASFTVSARLVVAADGAKSVVREAAGVSAQSWDYSQIALIANVFTQRFHEHVAYERFTSAGPIALLPLTEGRTGLVWTLEPPRAHEVAQLSDAEFLAELQQAFGFRLGRFTKVGVRNLYPLTLTRSEDHVAERVAVIGNAAQALHPIAGQGFNLGLRDAASLAEVLAVAQRDHPREFDAGNGLWLQQYREWRSADRSNIVRFTDGLVRVFTQSFGPVKLLRDAGLLAFDLMPAAKDALSQLSLGAAGRIPRMARGAPLKHAH
jgi:2-octaprenyl-6-methoxyphenol hydroxylase